jgi:two-component system response regulator GlrR
LSGKERLLLVEDDDALRRILSWELVDLGYCVLPAATCREARKAMADNDAGLALLDVRLPDGDGIALAEELSAGHPRLRILLCSGVHGAYNQRSVPSAVLACLTKPISVRHLDRILRSPGGCPACAFVARNRGAEADFSPD